MTAMHGFQEPATPDDLKHRNRQHVLRCFRDAAVCTVQEVCQLTGISRPTVLKCIRFFQERALLISLGKGASTRSGGKPPETYALTREPFFLCMALWPDELRVSAFSLDHTALGTRRIPRALPRRFDDVSPLLLQEARSFLAAHALAEKNLCAVSLSTSGIVDHTSNTLLYSSQSPQWGSNLHPLRDLMATFPQALFYMDNAGKYTARPFLKDPALARQRVLVLFTTWGIAGCLMERGHILNGPNALIGEIGHMLIAPEDPEVCGCGSRGCLERQVSPQRLMQKVSALEVLYPDSPLARKAHDSALAISDLFAFSASGDPLARRISVDWGALFASVLRNLSLTFDPDCVIIQGDFACADEAFLHSLRSSLSVFRYYSRRPPFQLSLDTRPLHDLDTEGAFLALDHLFFDRDCLYMDP